MTDTQEKQEPRRARTRLAGRRLSKGHQREPRRSAPARALGRRTSPTRKPHGEQPAEKDEHRESSRIAPARARLVGGARGSIDHAPQSQPCVVRLRAVPRASLRVPSSRELATSMNDPTKPNTVAGRLSALFAVRKQSEGLTYEKLADEVGVSLNKIGTWMRGDIEKSRELPYVPDAHELPKLARYFGVSVDYLVCYSDEPSGLQPGKWVVDQQLFNEFERAERFEQIAHHIETIGKRLFVDFRAEVPAGARLVDRAEAERMRARIAERLRELRGAKGGRKP